MQFKKKALMTKKWMYINSVNIIYLSMRIVEFWFCGWTLNTDQKIPFLCYKNNSSEVQEYEVILSCYCLFENAVYAVWNL
jgi:hypothetical protein